MARRRYSFFMPAEDHFFIKRFLAYYRIALTESGKILFCIAFISAAIASPGLHISAYLLTSLVAGLFVTAYFLALFNKPCVSVERLITSYPSAGDDFLYRVVVKNTGKKVIRNLTVREAVLPFGLYDATDHKEINDTVRILEPGASAYLKLAIRCQRRGIYELNHVYAGSSFPTGILRGHRRLRRKDSLFVYPKFITQSEFKLPVHHVYQPGGIAVSSHVGNSNEFLSTREYRHGDRLRDIHWPSFARTGNLIVREYVDEYFVRIGILLDTMLDRRENPDSFEKRLSITAGIADAVAKKEYIIDLFAAGDELHHFQMGRALAHLENLLELLACLEPVKRIDFEKLRVNLLNYTRELSTMIILLKDWDKPRAQLCHFLQEIGLSLRILVIRDKPLSETPDREITLISVKEKAGLLK